MKTMLLAVGTTALVCLAGAGHANNTALEPYTDIRVGQFPPGADVRKLFPGTSEFFVQATINACVKPSDPSIAAPPVAPLVAAIGGIVIDWLFARAASAISKRLKADLEKYTVSYANAPVYVDMFDKKLWLHSESCLVVQRVHCGAPAKDIKAGRARCEEGSPGRSVGLSVGLKLKQDGDLLHVLPYAEELAALGPEKPKHDAGDVSVAVTFRVDAIGRNSDGSGYLWKTQDVVVASFDCAVSKTRVVAGTKDSPCKLEHFDQATDWDKAWQYAHVLPRPPASRQAFVFTVGEVGNPPKRLQRFAEFFDATGEDLSAALSEALQKKIKLKKD